MAVCVDPSTISGINERVHSRRLTYDRGGTKESRIYDVPVAYTLADLIIAAGLAFGNQHWDYLGSIPYNVIRLANVSSNIPTEEDEYYELVLDFEYDYSSEYNDSGELWKWEFKTSKTHITAVDNSGDVAHYPATADVGLGIGIDGDDIEGVDVYRPSLSMSVSKLFETQPTGAYRSTLAEYQGSVNDSAFDGWSLGEVLFVGASLEKRWDLRWVIDYEFLIGKNQGTQSIVTTLGTVKPAPKAWEYMWFRYSSSATGDKKKTEIRSVHVNKVYPERDFSQLGLVGSYWT